MRFRMLEETAGRRSFLLVLAPEEEAVAAITAFAREQALCSASLSAIGAFSRARLGYFNPATREFVENRVEEQVEVVAMSGNIAAEDAGPKLHVHVVLGCRDASTRGGHLVEGWVRPTLEVILTEQPAHLQRAHDDETGLVLLKP